MSLVAVIGLLVVAAFALELVLGGSRSCACQLPPPEPDSLLTASAAAWALGEPVAVIERQPGRVVYAGTRHPLDKIQVESRWSGGKVPETPSGGEHFEAGGYRGFMMIESGTDARSIVQRGNYGASIAVHIESAAPGELERTVRRAATSAGESL